MCYKVNDIKLRTSTEKQVKSGGFESIKLSDKKEKRFAVKQTVIISNQQDERISG
jgi:hypothetical protein